MNRPSLRRLSSLAAATLLVACTVPPTVLPTPTPTRDPNALDVTILLDLSGPGERLGTLQRDAMEAWIHAQRGTPTIRPSYVDVASDGARTILALKGATDADADAVIVGAQVRYGELVAQAVDAAAIPVLFTLPIEALAGSGHARWAFALAPPLGAVAAAVVGDAVARGRLDSPLVLTDGAPGGAAERVALLAALRRQGRTLAPIALPGADAGRLARVAAFAASSVWLPGQTRAYADVLSGLPPAAPALFYCSYLTTGADLVAMREAAALVTWPGARGATGTTNTIAATAADAIAMLRAAHTQAAAPPTAERLRAALEGVTFSGVAARYTFGPGRHDGFPVDELVLLRWSARGEAYVAPDAGSER